MKRRILFLDDEPHVLDGPRHMLHAQRDRREMSVADGTRAALDELRDEVRNLAGAGCTP